MKKKTRSKHFVFFIFETLKTLKIKVRHNTQNFEKIAEISNERVKKKYNSSVT